MTLMQRISHPVNSVISLRCTGCALDSPIAREMSSDLRWTFRAALDFHWYNLWSLDPWFFVAVFFPSKIAFCKYTACFCGSLELCFAHGESALLKQTQKSFVLPLDHFFFFSSLYLPCYSISVVFLMIWSLLVK